MAELSRRRLQSYLRGVGSAKANCGDFNQDQYAALEPYLIEENGQKSFYSNVGDAGNKISPATLATISKVSVIYVIRTLALVTLIERDLGKNWQPVISTFITAL